MDVKLEVNVRSDLTALQQQQLIKVGSLPGPIDASGVPRLHETTPLSAGLPTEMHSPNIMGIPAAVSFPPSLSIKSEPTVPPGSRVMQWVMKRSREKPHGQDYYYRQLRRMRKTIKELIFLNSSVCDEVIRVEEKLARLKEERRYLLRKLLQFQAVDGINPLAAMETQPPGGPKSSKSPANVSTPSEQTPESVAKKAASKKKVALGTVGAGVEARKKLQNQVAKDLLESLQSKPKKSKAQSNRRIIPPLQLDSLGRPVFPMLLGDLTLHSIGEIVPDRGAFHTHECIYPAGFCSTRVYASIIRPQEKCLFTCKISDLGDIPEFEIAPEEGTEQVFRGSTPNECHSHLLQSINAALGFDILPAVGNGADFFGLTNPVVQNLIQSCPGSKKCPGYKWIKFEINKEETNENVAVGRNDPTISVDAFYRLLQQASGAKPAVTMSAEHATNLRFLLTKGSVPFSTP